MKSGKSMENKKAIFYREWLPLPKEQFRILIHLARNGSFSGNLSDLCRYFSLNPQSKTRAQIRNAIDELTEKGIIECKRNGRNYILKIIPKEKEIYLRPQWLDSILKADFSVSVSSEVVIKLLLWLIDRGPKMFTNEEVSNDLNISVTTINDAKKVLLNDFEVITRKYVYTVTAKGEIYRDGQIIEVSAWMKE